MIRRNRHRLPDGRSLVRVSPDLYQVQDAFGRVVDTVRAESVTIDETTVEEPCQEKDPHELGQAR